MSADFWGKEYCANVFVYYTKKAHWKPNATIGAMAYMLAEGLSLMGCGTYESYWVVSGPCGSPNCKLLDNQAWYDWINTRAADVMRGTGPYAGRVDIYSAFGLGLMADSNVWSPSKVLTVDAANKLVKAAMKAKKYWQDPAFQVPYYMNTAFTKETVWDTPGCDPVHDDRSADEWCRRLTAGYGMPAWHWTDGNALINAHAAKVPEAQTIYNNFPKDFRPAGTGTPFKPRLDSTGMNGAIYWYSSTNPLYASGFGLPNCTCYAWGRFWEIGDPEKKGANVPTLPAGNAGTWIATVDRSKYKVSSTPSLGAVAVFGGGPEGYGHVAVVEKIDDNGNILLSNSDYGGRYFYTANAYKSNNYYFGAGLNCLGFIENPHAGSDDEFEPYPPGPGPSERKLQLTCVCGLVVAARWVN